MNTETPTPPADAPVQIMPRVPTREQIEALEREMLKHPQLPIRTTHHFAAGLYAREIYIPAGTLLTGKVHSTEHLNIISKGEIQVWTEDGMKKVRAPFTLVSRPGTKRIGLAVTDTVWTTIHANPENTRDLDRLESLLILAPTLTKGEPPCLG